MAARAKAKKPAKAKGRTRSVSGGAVGSRGRVGKGHNSQILHAVPDETVVRCINLLDKDRKAMEKVKEELDSLRGTYRERRKEFKAFGFNLDAYDNTVKLRSMDLGKVQVDSADTGRYLRVLDHPLATQLELFQNMEAPPPEVDVALQGLNAGKGGEPVDNCPHQPGTADYVTWRANWEVGQQQVREGLRN